MKNHSTIRSMIVDIAEEESEPTNRPDAQPEQHERTDERRHVGVDDRAPCVVETAQRRVAQRAPVAYLVLQAFEEDDVRVDSDTDGDDDAGGTGQRERQVALLGQEASTNP